MGNNIRTGISYMYEPEFNRAILPLLECGEIDALEWSFDTIKNTASLPSWTEKLLKEFAQADRLYGHGVYYSMFSGGWHERHNAWFTHLDEVLKEYKFRHISEHFGFMTSSNAHQGAPLPVPFCEETLALGIQRLKQLYQAVQVPVGIENLAFAFSQYDIQQQGHFLEQLISPVEGFILLDLHNIYCQAANFQVDANKLIATYPLHRVKEIHVSGGSWEESPYSTSLIRRDTHDQAIPNEVYKLLEQTLVKCPNLEVVIVERLGDTLKDEWEATLFREEFLRIKHIVQAMPERLTELGWISNPAINLSYLRNAGNNSLQEQQYQILNILKSAANPILAQDALLKNKVIDQGLWGIKNWQLSMIDTAMQLGFKWGY